MSMTQGGLRKLYAGKLRADFSFSLLRAQTRVGKFPAVLRVAPVHIVHIPFQPKVLPTDQEILGIFLDVWETDILPLLDTSFCAEKRNKYFREPNVQAEKLGPGFFTENIARHGLNGPQTCPVLL